MWGLNVDKQGKSASKGEWKRWLVLFRDFQFFSASNPSQRISLGQCQVEVTLELAPPIFRISLCPSKDSNAPLKLHLAKECFNLLTFIHLLGPTVHWPPSHSGAWLYLGVQCQPAAQDCLGFQEQSLPENNTRPCFPKGWTGRGFNTRG